MYVSSKFNHQASVSKSIGKYYAMRDESKCSFEENYLTNASKNPQFCGFSYLAISFSVQQNYFGSSLKPILNKVNA